MKFTTTTFKGYSYDASYYINNDASCYIIDGEDCKRNADAVVEAMKAEYGPRAHIIDCGKKTFFGRPDYGAQLKGDCLDYTILYNPIETVATFHYYYKFYKPGNDDPADGYWNMKSGLTFPTREKLLPWQARGLMYTRTGYGKKIPTTKQLFILGRWRRIYCDIFSNSGVCYVIVDGQEINVDDCNMQ